VDKPILEGGGRGLEDRGHAEGRHSANRFVVGAVKGKGASLEGGSLNFARHRIAVLGYFKGKNPTTIVEVGGGGKSTNQLLKQLKKTLGAESATF